MRGGAPRVTWKEESALCPDIDMIIPSYRLVKITEVNTVSTADGNGHVTITYRLI